MHENMLNRARTARHDEGGFTLIELLIVIVVLGVLAGIVVFGVGTFKSDSEAAAKTASCKTVSVAAEAWAATNGDYPANVSDLTDAGYLKAPVPSGVGPGIDATTGAVSGCP